MQRELRVGCLIKMVARRKKEKKSGEKAASTLNYQNHKTGFYGVFIGSNALDHAFN